MIDANHKTSSSASSVPVFVFPPCLQFCGGRVRTLTLTLYNPYDFGLKFTLLSTNPSAFALSCAHGVIRSRHCLDISVRLKDQTIVSEKFLLQISSESRALSTGQKVIQCHNTDTDDSRQQSDDTAIDASDRFAPILSTSEHNEQHSQCRQFHYSGTGTDRQTSTAAAAAGEHRAAAQRGGQRSSSSSVSQAMTYCLAVILLAVLLLPHEEQSQSFFRIGFTHKLVVSYVLGLLTVMILRN